MRKIFKYNKDSLIFEPIKTKSYIKICLYVLTICGGLFILGWITGTNKYVVNHIIHTTQNQITDTLIIHGEPFSEDALVDLLQDCNIKYPYIVLAQAKLESGNFTSDIFKHNHNCFGLKKPHTRVTTAQGERNGFAYFRDWIDCVYDYSLLQENMMCNISSEDDYFAKLAEKYCQDTGYVASLKSIINKEHLKQKFEE